MRQVKREGSFWSWSIVLAAEKTVRAYWSHSNTLITANVANHIPFTLPLLLWEVTRNMRKSRAEAKLGKAIERVKRRMRASLEEFMMAKSREWVRREERGEGAYPTKSPLS